LRVPRVRQFGVWLRKRILLGGVVWGTILAVLFYLPGLIIFQLVGVGMTDQTGVAYFRYVFVMPIFVAFAFGFLLRDVEGSIKALVISQIIEWPVLLFLLTSYGQALFSSNPPNDLGLGLVVLAGFIILSFFLGFLASVFGSVVGSHMAARRRE
jgi:hypothetical protein